MTLSQPVGDQLSEIATVASDLRVATDFVRSSALTKFRIVRYDLSKKIEQLEIMHDRGIDQ